jgi:hypothetical protein
LPWIKDHLQKQPFSCHEIRFHVSTNVASVSTLPQGPGSYSSPIFLCHWWRLKTNHRMTMHWCTTPAPRFCQFQLFLLFNNSWWLIFVCFIQLMSIYWNFLEVRRLKLGIALFIFLGLSILYWALISLQSGRYRYDKMWI